MPFNSRYWNPGIIYANVVSQEVYTANLGFVGLGVMGSRMAKRLLEAGHSVTGYNRTKSKAQWLLDAGMKWGDSPRAVAELADTTLSMVTNTEALQAVTERRRRHLGGTQRRENLHRHEHGEPGGEPRSGPAGGDQGRSDARCAGVGQRDYARRRQAILHGRRADERPSSGLNRFFKPSVRKSPMWAATGWRFP